MGEATAEMYRLAMGLVTDAERTVRLYKNAQVEARASLPGASDDEINESAVRALSETLAEDAAKRASHG